MTKEWRAIRIGNNTWPAMHLLRIPEKTWCSKNIANAQISDGIASQWKCAQCRANFDGGFGKTDD